MAQSVSICPNFNLVVQSGVTGYGKVKIRCSSRSMEGSQVPKLEPFSRSKLDRILKEPSIIQKAENGVADYCSTLEGDASYSCWRGYFELKQLEKEAPKEEVEKLIIEAGGVKSLISCLHGISSMHKKINDPNEHTLISNDEKMEKKHFHVPDGLPKLNEVLEEEESQNARFSVYEIAQNKRETPSLVLSCTRP